jgi:hypothetical protein
MGLSSPSRPEIPITGGGLYDYGWPIALGPARAAPLDLLLGQQIIGVGLDEQLHEHRMHDAPSPGPAVLVACHALHRVEDRARPLIHPASTVTPPGGQVQAWCRRLEARCCIGRHLSQRPTRPPSDQSYWAGPNAVSGTPVGSITLGDEEDWVEHGERVAA